MGAQIVRDISPGLQICYASAWRFCSSVQNLLHGIHRYGAYSSEVAARFLENLHTFGTDLHILLSASTFIFD